MPTASPRMGDGIREVSEETLAMPGRFQRAKAETDPPARAERKGRGIGLDVLLFIYFCFLLSSHWTVSCTSSGCFWSPICLLGNRCHRGLIPQEAAWKEDVWLLQQEFSQRSKGIEWGGKQQTAPAGLAKSLRG
ncbi:chitotriosidase-1-like [Platysternon megacephalum]|uniref:Chitotriosidase-1-like n=1 Tax=Platysternon megacephalum TaxID=55544 RepID=A0A4D9EBL2_9SAUR|nr:chitotriosidase-1-like [Platysternon megacephalum]